MCMYHILKKLKNPNFSFYRAHARELDAQYAANVCTVIEPGMNYIWRYGASDIQMPVPVESKRNIDNRHQNNWIYQKTL